MTLQGWIGVVAYFIFATGVGQLAIRLFWFADDPLLHGWAAYYLAGQVVLTLATLSTAFLPWSIALLQYLLLAVLAAYWLQRLVRRRGVGDVSRGAILAAGFLLLVALVFPSLWVATQYVPLWEWDARSNWFFHGKGIFFDGRVSAVFFTNPFTDWSHHDYPLLIPAQAAWTALFAGGWNDYSSKAFLLFNFGAYACIFFKALAGKGFPWWVTGGITALVFDWESYSYVSGYADNHYVIAIVLALLSVALSGGPSRIPLAVLLLSFAASAKNEGTVYVVFLGLLLSIRAGIGVIRHGRPAARDFFAAHRKNLLWGLIVGVLPFVLWQTFKLIYGIRNDLDLGNRLTNPGLMTQLAQERWPAVLRFVGDFYLTQGGLLVLLLAVLLWLWRVHLRARLSGPWLACQSHEVLAWAMVAASQAFIVAVYIATPSDLSFHLSTSGTRLQFFPFMLLVLIAVYNATALLTGLFRGFFLRGHDPSFARRDARIANPER